MMKTYTKYQVKAINSIISITLI